MKMNIILFFSVLLNVFFIILLLRVVYYGKQMWTEIVEHDERIDNLLRDKESPGS